MKPIQWQRAMALLGASLFVGSSLRVLRTLPSPPTVASETVNPAAVESIQGQTAQWQDVERRLRQSIVQARARETVLRQELVAAQSSLAQLKSESAAQLLSTASSGSSPTLSQPLGASNVPSSSPPPPVQVHAITRASGGSERIRQESDDDLGSREKGFEHDGQRRDD